MEAKEIIKYISESKKRTPVKAYVKDPSPADFPNCKIFGSVVFGEWFDISPALEKLDPNDYVVESDGRNSAIPMLDTKNINARIEPGAIVRDGVQIGDNAVIMMGAIINIGSVIGDGSMIDMGVVMGGRATVGKDCHIGAGAVLAGVIEPPSANPVVIEDGAVIGANAVILEGCCVGAGAVVAAGAVVTTDIPSGTVAAGTPAKVIKSKDESSASKTQIMDALRNL